MTSPDGQTIGVVNVAVEPNTTGFRQEAQRDLDAIEASLPEVTVFVQPELTGVAELMGEVAALDRAIGDIQFGVQPTLTGMGDLLAEIAVAKAAMTDIVPNVPGGGLQPLVQEVANASDSIIHDTSVIRDAFDHLGYDPRKLTTFRVLRDLMESVGSSATKVGRNIRDGIETPVLNAEVGTRLLANTVRSQLTSAYQRVRAVAEDAFNPNLGFNFFDAFTPAIDRTIVRMTQLRNSVAIDLASAWDQVSAKARTVARTMSDAFTASTDRIGRGFRSMADGIGVRFLPLLDNLVVGMRLFEASASSAATNALNKLSNIRPSLDLSGLAGITGPFLAMVKSLGERAVIRLKPVLDNAAMEQIGFQIARLSGARLITGELDDMWKAFQNLDKALPIITSLTIGITGLVGWLTQGVANVGALAASLAQIGPLVLALPAIFAAAGISVGIFIAAFKDFGTIFPQVRGQLSALQDQISGNFWAQARAGMDLLLGAPWEAFRAGIATTSTSLGTLFNTLATSIAGGLDLTPMFAGLNSAIGILGQAAGPITTIIQLLGEAGSNILPTLADGFVKWTDTFATFLSDKGVGGLTTMFQTAIEQAGFLFQALGGLGNILLGIGQAATAGGGSTLEQFANTLDRIAAIVNGPVFQTVLTNLFQSAGEAMHNIATAAGPAVEQMFIAMAGTLSAILPGVGATIGLVFGEIAKALANPAFQTAVQSLFTGLTAAMNAFAPSIGPILGGLTEVFGHLGDFAAALGPVLGTALATLSTAIVGIAPALTPLINVLSSGLITVMTSLAPVIKDVATALASLISGGVVPAITAAIGALVPVISTLAPILGQIITTVLGAITPILPVLGGLIAQIASTLGAILAPILTALGPILGLLAGVIGQVVAAIAPFIQIALDLINAVLVPLLPVIMDLIQIALIPLMLAFQVLLPIIQLLGEGLQWVVENVIVPILMPIITQLATFLDAVLKPAIAAIGAIFSATWDLVKGVWDAFALLFHGDVAGFIQKIQEAFSGFRDKIKDIVIDLGKKMLEAFVDAWVNAQQTTVEWIGKVVDKIKELPGKAKDQIGDLGNLLKDAGKKIIQGLIDGIENALPSLGGVLGGVGSFIINHKGPPAHDAVMLFDAGQLIIDGLIDGMESRYKAVKKSLNGLSSSVEGTGFTVPVRTSGLASLAAMLNGGAAGGSSSSTLNYYAAPGSSINSQEDLFSALGRARAGW